MKQMFAATVVVCLVICLASTMMGQTTQFRFVQDAEFASVSQSTGPNSNFSLQVSRGFVTGSGATASLQYSAFSLATDPTTGNFISVTFTNEFGQIPTTAFTGQNTQNLALNIDTSTLDPSVFLTSTCTLDLTTFIETCGPGPTGVINLQFRENDFQSTVLHALQEEVTNGPITTRTHQKADTSTANVQGTIYGTAISSPTAQVGVNHMSSIEVVHNP